MGHRGAVGKTFLGRGRRRSAGWPSFLAGVGLAVAALAGAGPAGAQTLPQLFQFMQEGGAWLSLDIRDGAGSFHGSRLPAMGMTLAGWFQVAEAHRGTWKIRVTDLESPSPDPVIDVEVEPGQQVPFAYQPGDAVQVRVDVTWSEPADTVLFVWVGVPGRERSSPP